MRELPAHTRTVTAVRVWKARPGDGTTCEWFDRMFGDDEQVKHPPIGLMDLWWVGLPIAQPKHPDELGRTPDESELCCDHCLSQAVYLAAQSWEEANMDRVAET